MPEIRSLKPKHVAIMEWLIANPEKKLYECAAAFNVSGSWLSCILHSDIFQAGYQKLVGDYHDLRIVPMRDKLIGLAAEAVDKLADQVQMATSVEDRQFLLDVAGASLNRIGYNPSVPQNQSSVNINRMTVVSGVPPEVLEAARQKYRETQALTQVTNEPIPVADKSSSD